MSTRPAFFTAVTSVDSSGLLEAAVATGSLAMPSKLPAPSFGTEEQAGPNGSFGACSFSMPSDFSGLCCEAADDGDSAALSLLSEEQAARLTGRIAAAATATAVRRIRVVNMVPYFLCGFELVIRKIGGPRGSGYGCHGVAVDGSRSLAARSPATTRPPIGRCDSIAV